MVGIGELVVVRCCWVVNNVLKVNEVEVDVGDETRVERNKGGKKNME